MSIGERIRKLRKLKDWTQEELGQRVGIYGRNVARYENGHTVPRKQMMEKFARAFGVAIEDLEIDPPQTREPFLEDGELTALFREVYALGEVDKSAVKRVLTLIVKQSRIQQVIAS